MTPRHPERLRPRRVARDPPVPRCRCLLAVALAALAVSAACFLVSPEHEVVLAGEPTTLSSVPRFLSTGGPLRADNEVVGVCIEPGPGHHVSARWTVVTPAGREAQVTGTAELVDGTAVRLRSPSSRGSRLCVHPRLGGPLEAPVRSVSVAASTPIVVRRIVWRCGAP